MRRRRVFRRRRWRGWVGEEEMGGGGEKIGGEECFGGEIGGWVVEEKMAGGGGEKIEGGEYLRGEDEGDG